VGRPQHRKPVYRQPSVRRVGTAPGRPRFVPDPAPDDPAPDAEPEAPATDAAPAARLSSSVEIPTPSSLRAAKGYAPPLRGSRESLIRQNEKTEAEGLERIEDSDDLNDRIARKLLVPVPASPALTVNASLPEELRYCRPWTASFLSDLAQAHDAQFHRPITVSSAVRTVAYQKHLERINGNAAAAEGDIVSPHLTGGTIDIAKAGLPREELAWMRSWLAPLQEAGKIDVEEEFQQSCFHITVYQNYEPPPAIEAARKPIPKPRAHRHHSPIPSALAARTL